MGSDTASQVPSAENECVCQGLSPAQRMLLGRGIGPTVTKELVEIIDHNVSERLRLGRRVAELEEQLAERPERSEDQGGVRGVKDQ